MRITRWVVVLVLLSGIGLGGCGCVSGVLDEQYFTWNTSPYDHAWVTSDHITALSWVNETTGNAGDGIIVGPEYRCYDFLLFTICDDYYDVSYSIPLTPGVNHVQVTHYDADACSTTEVLAIDYLP